jgi:hypothetical protein
MRLIRRAVTGRLLLHNARPWAWFCAIVMACHIWLQKVAVKGALLSVWVH